jgi:hypothetical protein
VVRIAVIDGQGGGIGATIVKKLKEVFGEHCEVWALGTNAIATAQMMKARANKGATGEHALAYCAERVDFILGPVSILVPYAMMGEVTPKLVEAVARSSAQKILLPLTQEPLQIVGSSKEPLPHLVDALVHQYLAPQIESGGRP